MKIYPEIDYHFFITASLDERVRRKCKQYKTDDEREIRENIQKRDELQKQAGFYEKDNKTIEIDVTNHKTPNETIENILKYINKEEALYGV